MALDNICTKVIAAARTAGNFAMNEISELKGSHVRVKQSKDFVTYVDKACEEMIVSCLKRILPDAGFITEEGTVENSMREFTWVVDPLDGTTNYIHGIQLFAVSIALMRHNTTVLGVIYIPPFDECFHSCYGKKVHLNNKPVEVSDTELIADSLIVAGFPYENLAKSKGHTDLFKHFVVNARGIRRTGSAALDLAYVACGRFDALYETGLQPWDVAAGAFLVEQAGGKVTDYKGGKEYVLNKEIIACNKFIYPRFFKEIYKRLGKE